MRDVNTAQEWVERAQDLGSLAIDTETSTLDPMQATLCGFSLAVAPNEACYVPLAHRVGGEKGSLFASDLAPEQIPEPDALRVLKPVLEDRGVLKIGQNLKFNSQIFALRGIELGPYDDTMLMSYVLDAGRSDHGLDPLSRRYSIMRPSTTTRSPSSAVRASRSMRSISQRPPNTPPRTPTSPCGCGTCSGRASSPRA